MKTVSQFPLRNLSFRKPLIMNTKSLSYGSMLLVLFLFFTACKKKKEDLPPDYLKGIFIGGLEFSGNKAYLRYWKDSTQQTIEAGEIEVESESDFYKVAVTGTDVYINGEKRNPTTNIVEPYFWKNGVGSVAPIIAYDIAASGSDVYLAGRRSVAVDNGARACISKNGVITDLTDGSGVGAALAIQLNGNDVYAAGYIRSGNVYQGAYWKNGILNTITNAFYLFDISVNGTDVYVCGVNSNNKAAYWKNGIMTECPGVSVGSYAKAVLATGSDVHVVGDDKSGNITVASHWKNGVSQNIANASNGQSNANDIAMDGTDVYITGSQQTTVGKQAVYWKNGNQRLLAPAAKGIATAIKIIR
jgi:hypothetical protein